jgi:hypothetical protein
MRPLHFGTVEVTVTKPATLILWLLFSNPHRPIDAARMMAVDRSTAIKRLQVAAERLPNIHLAVAMREHVFWTGGIATYRPLTKR